MLASAAMSFSSVSVIATRFDCEKRLSNDINVK